MISPPRGFERFQQGLSTIGIDANYDTSTAATLRLFARVKNGGIILMTGPDSLVYAPWVMEGMSMTSRLIVQVEGGFKYSLLAALFSTDIRVAAHVQDTTAFLDDLVKYHFEMIVADQGIVVNGLTDKMIGRLSDDGAMMLVTQQGLVENDVGMQSRISLEKNYFVAPFGKDQHSLMVSKFGEQQLATRKGGRRARQNK